MKNLFITFTVFLTVSVLTAQTEPTITKPESVQTEYAVTAGDNPVSLTATDAILLNEGVHIQNGADFHAYISGFIEGPYEPPVLSTSGQNYIFTRTYQQAMPNATSIASNSDVIEGIAYFDGLGRPVQQIAIKASPALKDIITHLEYDDFGRMEKEFLSYEAPARSTEPLGSLRPDAEGDTYGYYTSNYATDLDADAPNPFSEKLFETSPLNRVLKQAAPGEDWKMGNGHEIRLEYQTNIADEVRRFKVTFNNNNTKDPQLEGWDSFYTEKELYKNIIKDENWQEGQTHTSDHTTEEFTDKNGRVVLKRTHNQNDPHDTYYVYDDFGNLTYVIPPKVVVSDGVNTTELDGLCYQYRYDHRNRLIEKKIPGKGSATDWESIVYNTLDQPIMTQDPNLKDQGKWLFTKYDVFGRVAYTGMISSTENRSAHQSNVDAYANNENNKLWVASGTFSFGGQNTGYDNSGYPNNGYDELLTIQQYDNYDQGRDGISKPNGSVLGQNISNNVHGLPTVSKIKVLGENQWITTLTSYDEKARAIYSKTVNPYLGTTDIVESELDFAGKVINTKTTHTKGNNSPIVVNEALEYDHVARLKSQIQVVNGEQERLFSNTYDGIGQLVKKEIGNTKANPLQQVDYTYNIRGWLKTINQDTDDDNDLFDFGIKYNDITDSAKQLFNGNISQTNWDSKSVNIPNAIGELNDVSNSYTYTYDALSRIKSGIDNTGHYNLNDISYDKNGNIQSLVRNGHTNANETDFGVMDQLTYVYAGNQLQSVTDIAQSTGFLDGNTTNTDYVYDTNGNMISDLNKGITRIEYNFLNLPTQVVINGGSNIGIIDYVYDATGAKQKKTVTNTGVGSVTTTDYANGYLYEGNTLQFFNHSEGYITPSSQGGYDYVYQYKDHLGNIRLSYTDADNNGTIEPSSEIINENNYYPFGLTHRGYNGNVSPLGNSFAKKYKFGGKEYQVELDLGWYDIVARNYDASLGRFMNLDPHAENYYEYTPYNFVANNPLVYIDPDGRDYRINIYQDDDGKWHMEINSTVHVFSDQDNASEKVDEYNSFVQENADKFKGTYTAEDGTEVAISLNINYVEGKKDSKDRTKNFKKGDNKLALVAGATRHSSMGAYGINEKKGTVGTQVVMDGSSDYYSAAATVHHDMLHQIGLGDRYSEPDRDGNSKAVKGYERDLMGFGPRTEYLGEGFEFKQIHFNNFGKTLFVPYNPTYMNKRVDCATITNPDCKR